MVHRIEDVVAATPEVAGFARRTGAELGLFATEQNRGDIVVKLKPPSERKRNVAGAFEARKAWRLAGARLGREGHPPGGKRRLPARR